MHFAARILGPEKSFYWLAVVYGIGIGILSLAVPISVQMLINTVANIGLTTQLVVLAVTLFGLLLLGGLLNALRIHLMDIFGRRFYARMVANIAVCSLQAKNPFFHDHSDGPLFNRYFDIVIVQKTLPNLLVGGFTIILQAVVGFALVSMYHPMFFGFNVLVVLCILAVLVLWLRKGISTAVNLSHRKHATAAWLEDIAASNGFFKSKNHIAYALRRTEAVTADYIHHHKRHFRAHFTQTLLFLFIYAAASAALLGIGGWLVIGGELTLGQLVAAELVLSAVFVGVSQMGIYLSYFYDICGAVDELSLFYDVEQEQSDGAPFPPNSDAKLEFINARGIARGEPALFDFSLSSGARVLARASTHGAQRLFANLVRRREDPQGGYLTLGGTDMKATDLHQLRLEVMVLHRISAVEMRIRDYLSLGAREGTPTSRLIEVIRAVDLEDCLAHLPEGLDTTIAATGYPLSTIELLKLKLAAAIMAQPRVLVVNQLFDMMPEGSLKRAFDLLQQSTACTIVHFSDTAPGLDYSQYLALGLTQQLVTTDEREFLRHFEDARNMLTHAREGA